MKTGKIILATTALALFGVGAGVMLQQQLQQQTAPTQHSDLLPAPVQVLESLPELSLPDIDGETFDTAQLAGKVVILNFWATWCPPCRKEIPHFISLQQELGDKGLQFVGIAIDEPTKVAAYSRETAINYPILLGDMAEMELSRRLGNRFQSLPFSAIFDRQGKLLHIQSGELSKPVILDQIAPLM